MLIEKDLVHRRMKLSCRLTGAVCPDAAEQADEIVDGARPDDSVAEVKPRLVTHDQLAYSVVEIMDHVEHGVPHPRGWFFSRALEDTPSVRTVLSPPSGAANARARKKPCPWPRRGCPVGRRSR
jgi:hypothetical protein